MEYMQVTKVSLCKLPNHHRARGDQLRKTILIPIKVKEVIKLHKKEKSCRLAIMSLVILLKHCITGTQNGCCPKHSAQYKTWTLCLIVTCCWVLSCLGTQLPRHSVAWALSCLGTQLPMHPVAWAFSCLCTQLPGHSVSWALSCLGTHSMVTHLMGT